ncbi:Kinesin-like protein KIN-14F, partial [Cucurbita argyrosperma subsp. sororia]
MPQEFSFRSSILTSPNKNMRGLKALVPNCNEITSNSAISEEVINDDELAQRKAEEAALRRNQAVEWLRQMDHGALGVLSKEPSEEEFCLALRNGLILCIVLNKVNPGVVPKVVESPVLTVQSTEGAAQSAIQYFENMRNFLEAVKNMKLLTFEASDLEKGGTSSKVVECILCLKGYYEWKQAGGIGVWRYGGTVRITSLAKSSPSVTGTESTDESDSSRFEQLLDFLHLSNEVSVEESRTCSALAFLFDRFGLKLLQAYLKETNEIEDFPLNAMVIDALLNKVVKDFSALLMSQGTQLGLFLKKMLKSDLSSLSKSEFIEAISRYISQRANMASSDISKFCVCGGKREVIHRTAFGHEEQVRAQQNQIQELNSAFQETKLEVKHIQSQWNEEVERLEHHLKGLEMASSSYHKVLEENRILYNQVQDLKGTIRVYCRVRPFLPGQANQHSTVDYIGENGNIMIGRRVFSFNKVYGTNVTQGEIYMDTQPLIRSVLDDIRNNSQLSGLNVPDASWVPVTCTQDVLHLMNIGHNNRAIGATALNERSSRSHSVLIVHLLGKDLVSGSIIRGCLHLVDLAGSERVDKSEAVGDRLKEAQHINKSLSALGDVISALAQKSAHIPYRNSKLTQLLQDSLGGQAKTLMFVHINSEADALGETISTLKFAERVASIELGAARCNKENSQIQELKDEISNLKSALERKDTELEQLKGGNARALGHNQKPRTASPLRVLRHGTNGGAKPEHSQRPLDDTKTLKARSCSSGKQRRSRFPSTLTEKDAIKMRLLGEERSTTSSSSGNPRSPSPPVRRSISTDRGALLRSKVKTETNENQPIAKPSSFLDIQKATMGSTKKKQLVCQEKNEQDSRKSDFSEMENDQFLGGMPLGGALKVKKACHNFPRNSQNLEPPRVQVGAVETLLRTSRVENGSRNQNKVRNGSMPEFGRSRSTTRRE